MLLRRSFAWRFQCQTVIEKRTKPETITSKCPSLDTACSHAGYVPFDRYVHSLSCPNLLPVFVTPTCCESRSAKRLMGDHSQLPYMHSGSFTLQCRIVESFDVAFMLSSRPPETTSFETRYLQPLVNFQASMVCACSETTESTTRTHFGSSPCTRAQRRHQFR